MYYTEEEDFAQLTVDLENCLLEAQSKFRDAAASASASIDRWSSALRSSLSAKENEYMRDVQQRLEDEKSEQSALQNEIKKCNDDLESVRRTIGRQNQLTNELNTSYDTKLQKIECLQRLLEHFNKAKTRAAESSTTVNAYASPILEAYKKYLGMSIEIVKCSPPLESVQNHIDDLNSSRNLNRFVCAIRNDFCRLYDGN